MLYGIGYDIGKSRKINEDFYGIYRTSDLEAFVLADGMGGHSAGDVASKMAVEDTLRIIEMWDAEKLLENDEQVCEYISNLLCEVNSCVHEYAMKNSVCEGMGTTMVLCIALGSRLYYANIGDSRLYGIKDGAVIQLTKDHSLVQELVDIGQITKDQAAIHPNKNIITKAIGTDISVIGDIAAIDKTDYDAYLMCTDGLTNMLANEEMNALIEANGADLNSLCNAFVSYANEKGGYDNITVIVFKEQST